MSWEIDTSYIQEMRQAMRDGLEQLVTDAATIGLEAAKEAVPNTELSRGYSLGSLKESGYVLSAIKDGYDEAVSNALSIQGTRIAKRDQVEPKFPVELYEKFDRETAAVAVFDFPLTYAGLINDGFHHLLARRFIIGVAYITSGIDAGTARMRVQEAALVTQIMNLQR